MITKFTVSCNCVNLSDIVGYGFVGCFCFRCRFLKNMHKIYYLCQNDETKQEAIKVFMFPIPLTKLTLESNVKPTTVWQLDHIKVFRYNACEVLIILIIIIIYFNIYFLTILLDYFSWLNNHRKVCSLFVYIEQNCLLYRTPSVNFSVELNNIFYCNEKSMYYILTLVVN